ncbi:YcbK family protein [Phaeovulum sp.]|uniref:YcbK family protein n=1 Tax=Phaeovulum sp. TaxID=2934796 RepID=UPI003567E181
MTSSLMTRRGLIGAFAATMVVAAPTSSKAFGFLKGAGDIRRISMFSGRTGESIDIVYWVEGEYIKEAMAEISHFMRDVRSNEVKAIDARTIDIAAASHRLLETSTPYNMLSGYRSQATNDAMRRSSSGVAKNSLHIQGQAADLRLDGRSVSQIYKAAASCNAGGVGKYSRSNFVHMDCGPLRTWGG